MIENLREKKTINKGKLKKKRIENEQNKISQRKKCTQKPHKTTVCVKKKKTNTMEEKPNCMSCHTEITDARDCFECDGACNRYIHIDCTHIEKKYLPVFEKCENAFYVCDECSVNGLKSINNKVNGLYQHMFKVHDKLRAQGEEIKKLVEVIKQTNETLKKLKSERGESTQTPTASSTAAKQSNEKKNTNKTTANDNNVHASTSSNKNNNNEKQSNNSSEKSHKKGQTNNQAATAPQKQKQATEKKQPTKSREKTNTVNSKPAQQKQNVNTQEKKTQNKISDEINKTVIIKPKQQQSSENTMNDIQAKIRPNDIKFESVRKTTNGCVIINCETTNECNKLKNKISVELNEKYEIKSPELFKPKIKIFGMDKSSDGDSICDQIKSNNRELANSELKLIKLTEDRNDAEKINGIFEIDSSSFNKIMIKRKVKLGWQHYKVGHHLNLMRCFNCYGFNHQKDECTNERACPECSGDHEVENCDATEKCCSNCQRANQKFNIQMDTNHDVWSNKCEILKRKRNQASKKVDYSDE